MPFLFEKLDVYRRALDLADDLTRGSAHECIPLVELGRRRSLVTASDHAVPHSELDEICKTIRMTQVLIRGIPRRRAP